MLNGRYPYYLSVMNAEGEGTVSKLERIAYVFMIAVSILSIGILIEARLSHRNATPQNRPPSADALVGKTLDIPGVVWNSSRVNVVVYLSTTCHFCQASMPFYRRLVSERHSAIGGTPTLLAVSAEPSNDVQRYLADEQVEFDHIYQIKMQRSILLVTPAFLVVDMNGVIRRAIYGELSVSVEDELLRQIKTGKLGGKEGL